MSQFDIKVFITTREASCDECGEDLGRKAWIVLVEDKGALCLACADLDHLLFLPAGDAALTRRSRKYSTLCAVVLKWSRARRRYERQGLLVEAKALERGYPGLKIPGAFEYMDSLDVNVSKYLAGELATAKEALDATAKDWDRITKKFGAENQKTHYAKMW